MLSCYTQLLHHLLPEAHPAIGTPLLAGLADPPLLPVHLLHTCIFNTPHFFWMLLVYFFPPLGLGNSLRVRWHLSHLSFSSACSVLIYRMPPIPRSWKLGLQCLNFARTHSAHNMPFIHQYLSLGLLRVSKRAPSAQIQVIASLLTAPSSLPPSLLLRSPLWSL